MKNIGLDKVIQSNTENFTSKTGIKIRRFINSVFRRAMKLFTARKIHLDNYPKLEAGVPYIFASTHSFDEDIIAAIAVIDRNAYLLTGATDQVENNPKMYAAWVNGIIYVDRQDKQNRKDSVDKMEQILKAGSSILIFPEGGWNNTENELVQPLFAGPYELARRTGAKVVPMASFNEHDSKDIYIKFSEPLDLAKLNKKEALTLLRDNLATMVYANLEEHTDVIKRQDLDEDCRQKFMESRKCEYQKVKWTRDIWDEELAYYLDKNITTPAQIRESLKNVKITEANKHLVQSYLDEYESEEKYNFKKYMKSNWNK